MLRDIKMWNAEWKDLMLGNLTNFATIKVLLRASVCIIYFISNKFLLIIHGSGLI